MPKRNIETERRSLPKWTPENHKYGHHFSFHLELAYISDKIKSSLESKLVDILGISPKALTNRFLQILISTIYVEFSDQHWNKCTESKGFPNLDLENLVFENYKVNLRSGEVKLGLKRYSRLFIRTYFYYIKNYFKFLSTILFGKERKGSASIFLENIPKKNFFSADRESGKKMFESFIREFEIPEFRNIESLYVATSYEGFELTDEKINFVSEPFFEATNHLPKKFSTILSFTKRHLMSLTSFSFNALKNPLLFELGKDFSDQAVLQTLSDHKCLKDIFYTNSLQFNLPVSMTDLKDRSWINIMLWYTAGCDYISYDKFPADLFKVRMQYIRFDHSYFWSDRQASRLLEGIEDFSYSVVRPIMFHLPEEPILEANIEEKSIVIFDEIPHRQEINESVYGKRYRYWDIECCKDFLTDICNSVEKINLNLEKPWKIYLKPKRAFISDHHVGYIELVNGLKERGVLEILPESQSVFSTVKKSRLCLVAPFASPSHVASLYGTNCFYYDPKAEINFISADHKGIGMLKGSSELSSKLSLLLS